MAIVWEFMLHPVRAGEHGAEAAGLQGHRWLQDRGIALYLAVRDRHLAGAGFNMVLFSPASPPIPKQLYDAAAIDGAEARGRASGS